MNYSEYEESTGLFTGAVVTVESEAALLSQMRPGMNFAQGAYLRDLYRVDPATKQVIEPSAEAMARYQTRPSWPSEWDRMSLQWVDLRSLADHKATKVAQIKAEAVSRIEALIPGMRDLATILAMRELYLSIVPAARSPTASLTKVMAIYAAAAEAVEAVRQAASPQAIEAVTVNWPAA
jgi:hypothetical protein